MTAALSWTPRRVGPVYCSPACGGKCRHADYLKAKETAAYMVKALGSGWRPRVWENLGWHAAAITVKGDFRVFPYREGGGYHSILAGHYSGTGRTPLVAARSAALKMKAAVTALEAAFGSSTAGLA